MKMDHDAAVRAIGILHVLREFDARLAGTPPLDLDLPGSDIDVLCHAPDPIRFAAILWREWSLCPGFSLHQWTSAGRPVVARFHAHGWEFEVFGQAVPVDGQMGWRHFVVERRLLERGSPALRAAVMARRRSGAKTEAAFAQVLRLDGDPFEAIAALALAPDEEIDRHLARAGYAPGAAPSP
ncbi:DUF4269 domain-containing protein [Roseococcus thiosulfatophilus]|uniref:DUF4269 domain-containing protein n=1 Tax=Roseococcus thiosulfatophilus TaxID=35813 RepID=UPI001A8C644A|nr:DUF4269 domain-containing protein [Roseococcus thiosulfatophilus]